MAEDAVRIAEDPAVEARNIRFILLTVVVVVAANTVSSIFGLGLPGAILSTALLGGMLVAHIIRHKDRRVLGWLLVGLGAGFTELAADWWLVMKTGSLVYPADEPQIVVSPLYMPFAWANILAQLGMLSHWLRRKLGMWRAAIVTGLFAGINIPLYEHLAAGAEWWYYKDTPMLFGAPWYIIVGEFFLGLPMVVIDRFVERTGAFAHVLLGVFEGLVIFGAYWLAWQMVGPCSGAWIQLSCG